MKTKLLLRKSRTLVLAASALALMSMTAVETFAASLSRDTVRSPGLELVRGVKLACQTQHSHGRIGAVYATIDTQEAFHVMRIRGYVFIGGKRYKYSRKLNGTVSPGQTILVHTFIWKDGVPIWCTAAAA